MRINGHDVNAFTLATLRAGVVAIPEDTRTRLGLRVGSSVAVGGHMYEVIRAPLPSIKSRERAGVPQSDMVFFRSIPDEASARPARPAATAPSPAVAVPVEPAEAPVDPVVEEPQVVLPKTRVNGRQMVLCVGHNMLASDVDNNIVRLPKAARTALEVNREGNLTINGRTFVVHEAYRTDLEQYSSYDSLVGSSEIIFMHPRTILETDQVFDVERVSMHLPIVDEAEAARTVRARIEEILGTDLSQDIEVECTVTDGLTSVKLRYLPGLEAVTEAPANLNAAITNVAGVLRGQLGTLQRAIQNLLNGLPRL